MILYEYPFGESIRTTLRLEHLFDRLGVLMWREDPVDHHFALATIFEIMDVAARADLKSDLQRDLDRHKQQFMGYRGNPAIQEAALDEVLARIERVHHALNQVPGKAGQSLASVVSAAPTARLRWRTKASRSSRFRRVPSTNTPPRMMLNSTLARWWAAAMVSPDC